MITTPKILLSTFLLSVLSTLTYAAILTNVAPIRRQDYNGHTPVPDPKEHRVLVGPDGKMVFEPEWVHAVPGDNQDTVIFEFRPGNWSVTQSTLESPCDGKGGFKTGFVPVPQDAKEFPTFKFALNDSFPVYFYCGQQQPVNACQSGMVFAINPPQFGVGNFTQFKDAAMQGAAAAPKPGPVEDGQQWEDGNKDPPKEDGHQWEDGKQTDQPTQEQPDGGEHGWEDATGTPTEEGDGTSAATDTTSKKPSANYSSGDSFDVDASSLAASDDTSTHSGVLQKYAVTALGLLGANLVLGLAVLAIAVLIYKKRNVPAKTAQYVPVGFRDKA